MWEVVHVSRDAGEHGGGANKGVIEGDYGRQVSDLDEHNDKRIYKIFRVYFLAYWTWKILNVIKHKLVQKPHRFH
jgi:hypothetical protein